MPAAREYETWRIARCMLRGLPADRLDERRERLAEPALVGALAPAGVHGGPRCALRTPGVGMHGLSEQLLQM